MLTWKYAGIARPLLPEGVWRIPQLLKLTSRNFVKYWVKRAKNLWMGQRMPFGMVVCRNGSSTASWSLLKAEQLQTFRWWILVQDWPEREKKFQMGLRIHFDIEVNWNGSSTASWRCLKDTITLGTYKPNFCWILSKGKKIFKLGRGCLWVW